MRKNILKIATANLLSKPLALLRQVVFAAFYGVTAVMSAARFAQTITLVFLNFFTTDILNAGFLPLFDRYKKESAELAQCYFWCLFLMLATLSLAVFSVLYFGAPTIVHFFAPGFPPAVAGQTVAFIRVFSFSVPFSLIGSFLAYRGMSAGFMFAVSTRPMFESVGLIAGALLSVWLHNPLFIAWGFVLAVGLFFLIAASICYFNGELWLVSPRTLLSHARNLASNLWDTVRVLLLLPLFIQGKFVAEKMVASLIAVSAVAALDYARFVVETGINVLAMPIGVLGLSVFSVMSKVDLSRNLEKVVSILLGITIPFTFFLVLNSRLVISILYGYGEFNDAAITQASAVLSSMSILFFADVTAYALVKVMSSQLQNDLMVKFFMISIAANVVFLFATYKFLGMMSLGFGQSILAGSLFVLCVRHFQLTHVVLDMFKKLLPAAVIYIAGVLYLQHLPAEGKWITLLEQGSWFTIFWVSVLYAQRSTRELLFSWVAVK